jgi:tetratricopeptide (TPR) repeat protein
MALSGISEEEFYRLVYLFRCLNVIHISEVQQEKIPRKRIVEARPRPVIAVSGVKEEKPVKTIMEEKPEVSRIMTPQHAIATDLGQYYFHCAKISFERKNNWAAVEYCRKALEHRKDSRIYQLMGDALATHPSFRHEAMDAYKRALELSPLDSGIHRAVADLYYATGSYALAKSRYQVVLRLRPDDEVSRKRLEELDRVKKKKR